MANPITNKVKTGGIPVIKKDLEDGVIAEANNDGTIYLDKKVKNNTPLAKEAIAHEMVHMDQMARGDLDYNDDKVFWKGKSYDRDDMNEGSKNLPWEKEAYNKTKNMKKSPMKLDFGLSSGAIDTNRNVIVADLQAKAGKRGALGEAVGKVAGEIAGFDAFAPKDTNPNDKKKDEKNDEDTPAGMNKKNKNKSAMKMKSTPITKKSKHGGSPLHVETETVREFKGNVDGEYGTITETEKTNTERKKKKSVNEFAENCGTKDNPKAESYVNSEGKTIACKWADDDDFDKESEYDEPKTIYDSAFSPDEVKSKQPGTPDKRNMGYYESMDAKWGAGVRNRGDKKVRRIAERSARKFDRKGGNIIDPKTGEAYGDSPEGRAKFIKDRAMSASGEYNIPVGKTRFGTPEGPETTSNAQAKEGEASYKKIDGKFVKVDKDGNPIEMNKKSKNKSAFKMNGWSAY